MAPLDWGTDGEVVRQVLPPWVMNLAELKTVGENRVVVWRYGGAVRMRIICTLDGSLVTDIKITELRFSTDFDQALFDLYDAGHISYDEAIRNSDSGW